MNGRMITLFRKRMFDYTFLPEGATVAVTLRRAIPIQPFYYYSLLIRVHNCAISSGIFLFEAQETLPSAEDPQEFVAGTEPPLYLDLEGGSVPLLLSAEATNCGPYLKLVMVAEQRVGAGQFYAELSAVLVVRVK